MRRLLALVLLLTFGLPGVTPLFALGAGSEASIPACCRRAGAHGCMHQHAPHDGSQPALVAPRCPFAPSASLGIHVAPASFASTALLMERVDVRTAAIRQTQAQGRVSEGRSNQKRGPPVTA